MKDESTADNDGRRSLRQVVKAEQAYRGGMGGELENERLAEMQENMTWPERQRGERIVVEVERQRGYGSVPGLEDEELADEAELERGVALAQWGPIMSLPAPVRSGFRPSRDEQGNLDGAFGSVDCAESCSVFDKARYKADKLRQELRYTLIMLDSIMQHLPGRAKFQVLRLLRMGVIDLDHIEDMRMHAIACWFLRSVRLREQIRDLRDYSYQRREMWG